MRRTHALRVLGPLLAALVALGGLLVSRGAPSHAAAPGVIVFASDRDKSDPGEIYSLAPGSAPRDVSRSEAPDYGLAVAPVGNLIAFWSSRGGTDGMYLAREDGSHLRLVRAVRGDLVATPAGSGGLLAFSADASVVLAVAYTQAAQAGSTSHLWLVDTRTATARSLRSSCNGLVQPSPDGRMIACGHGRATTVRDIAGRLRFTLPGLSPIWSSRGWLAANSDAGGGQTDGSTVIADAAGRTVERVKGRALAWSPDGRLLLFTRGQALWEGDAGNLARARLLLANWGGARVSFPPDGRYVSTSTGKGEPVLVPLAGGPPIAGLDGGNGTWSRTGRVAYVGGIALPGGIRPGVAIPVLVSDTHGRNPRVAGRFPFDDHAYADLRWPADGRRVLFLTANSCGGKGLFAVSSDGGATRRLTEDPRDLETPAWSPDGTRIAHSVQDFSCHLGAGEPIHLETVGADGTGPARVTDDGDRNLGSFDTSPAFSPDGTQIVFDHGTFNDVSLQVVATVGGVRTTLLSPGAVWPGAPAWSPDGTKIAYASERSIKAIAPSGGTPEVLATGLPAQSCGNGGLAWSPGGNQLAIGAGDGIYLITVGEPASARLAIRAKCAGDPSFSPDGTQIAFDAPTPRAPGNQTSIMVAHVDGSGVRTLSTTAFRESVHPTWQPVP
jgi:Tol biopolymer transport system component